MPGTLRAVLIRPNLSTARAAQGEVRSHSPSKSSAADPGYLIRDFSCPKRSSTSPALGKQNPQAGKRSRHQLLFRTGNAIRYHHVVLGNILDLSHREEAVGNTWDENACGTREGTEISECTAIFFDGFEGGTTDAWSGP